MIMPRRGRRWKPFGGPVVFPAAPVARPLRPLAQGLTPFSRSAIRRFVAREPPTPAQRRSRSSGRRAMGPKIATDHEHDSAIPSVAATSRTVRPGLGQVQRTTPKLPGRGLEASSPSMLNRRLVAPHRRVRRTGTLQARLRLCLCGGWVGQVVVGGPVAAGRPCALGRACHAGPTHAGPTLVMLASAPTAQCEQPLGHVGGEILPPHCPARAVQANPPRSGSSASSWSQWTPVRRGILDDANSYRKEGIERETATSSSTRPGTTSSDVVIQLLGFGGSKWALVECGQRGE